MQCVNEGLLEQFSIERRKTKTKQLTNQLLSQSQSKVKQNQSNYVITFNTQLKATQLLFLLLFRPE